MMIGEPVPLRSAPPVPWKNGGGITRTLVTMPENAGLDDFAWRISMAEIKTAGGFSAFPGVDRTILLWRGDGVLLRSPQWPEHKLTEVLRPFAFRGEDEVSCELAGGLTEDLNLMVRRTHAVAELHVASSEAIVQAGYSDLIILCFSGRVRLQSQQGRELQRIEQQHMLSVSAPDEGLMLIPEEPQTRFVYVTARLLV